MASSSSNMDSDSGIHYHPYRITRSQSRSTSQPSSQSATTDLSLPSQPVREKRLYLSSEVIESARERLLTFQEAHEEGEEEEECVLREITIKENVSLKKYLRYRKNNVISSVHMN